MSKTGYVSYDDNTQELEKKQKKLDGYKLGLVLGKDVKPKDLARIMYAMIQQDENTYYENGRQQCYGGTFRSTEDIYRVAKSYIPNLTLRHVVKALKLLTEYDHTYTQHCSIVRKDVHNTKTMLGELKNWRKTLGSLNLKTDKKCLEELSI